MSPRRCRKRKRERRAVLLCPRVPTRPALAEYVEVDWELYGLRVDYEEPAELESLSASEAVAALRLFCDPWSPSQWASVVGVWAPRGKR